MTFKHIKIGESPTMRALEKVAREKGLVKDEPVQKTAMSKKADVSPTTSLMQNVFKLCAGLREKGLVKEAAELEMNYLSYKQAQTLYEAHKEKGEDLLHDAHPQGSHKLEGVEGNEATVEDLIARHTKFKEVAEKKPTGKISDAASLLREIKIALGQDAMAEIKSLAKEAAKLIDQVVNESNPELTFSATTFSTDVRKAADNPTVYVLNSAIESINALHHRLDPSIISGIGYGFSGVSDYTWGRIQPWMAQAVSKLREAISKRKDFDAGQSDKIEGGGTTPGKEPTAPAAGSDLERKIRGMSAQYNALSGQLSSEDPKDADALTKTKAWLTQKAADLVNLAEKFHNESDKESVGPIYQGTLAKYQKALATIQQEWA